MHLSAVNIRERNPRDGSYVANSPAEFALEEVRHMHYTHPRIVLTIDLRHSISIDRQVEHCGIHMGIRNGLVAPRTLHGTPRWQQRKLMRPMSTRETIVATSLLYAHEGSVHRDVKEHSLQDSTKRRLYLSAQPFRC